MRSEFLLLVPYNVDWLGPHIPQGTKHPYVNYPWFWKRLPPPMDPCPTSRSTEKLAGVQLGRAGVLGHGGRLLCR